MWTFCIPAVLLEVPLDYSWSPVTVLAKANPQFPFLLCERWFKNKAEGKQTVLMVGQDTGFYCWYKWEWSDQWLIIDSIGQPTSINLSHTHTHTENLITGVSLGFWGCLIAGWVALEPRLVSLSPGMRRLCLSPQPAQLPWRPSLPWRSCWWPDHLQTSTTCPWENNIFFNITVTLIGQTLGDCSQTTTLILPWSGQEMSKWGEEGCHMGCQWNKHPWRWNHPE